MSQFQGAIDLKSTTVHGSLNCVVRMIYKGKSKRS